VIDNNNMILMNDHIKDMDEFCDLASNVLAIVKKRNRELEAFIVSLVGQYGELRINPIILHSPLIIEQHTDRRTGEIVLSASSNPDTGE